VNVANAASQNPLGRTFGIAGGNRIVAIHQVVPAQDDGLAHVMNCPTMDLHNGIMHNAPGEHTNRAGRRETNSPSNRTAMPLPPPRIPVGKPSEPKVNGAPYNTSSSVSSQAEDEEAVLVDAMDDKKLIAHIHNLFTQFDDARKKEDEDVENMIKTCTAADQRHRFVSERLQELKMRHQVSEKALGKAKEELAIFRGVSTEGLESAQIEAVYDSLNNAREQATVGQAQYDHREHPELPEKKEAPWIAEPEKINFEVPQLPPIVSDNARTTKFLIEKLLTCLKKLHKREDRTLTEYAENREDLRRVQSEHNSLIFAHEGQVVALKKIETEKDETEKTLSYLSGNANLDHLKLEELKELSNEINTYVRKVTLSLAMRELQAHPVSQAQANAQKDKDKCAICFERNWDTTLTPCGHVLCHPCSAKLNHCPNCRTRIVNRQKVYKH